LIRCAVYVLAMERLTNVRGVERVVEYQSNYADKSVILDGEYAIKPLRVEYLKNYRFEWEWVESSTNGKPYVLLKRRKS